MYKNVLLATDLLTENNILIERALKLSKEWGAKLTMAHIVEPLPSYGYAYVGSADVEETLINEAKKQLAQLAEKYGLSEDNLIVETGPTKTEIVRIAEDHKMDLIVLGSHGRHGFAALLGSTANSVLHSAVCDVLTIRLPEQA